MQDEEAKDCVESIISKSPYNWNKFMQALKESVGNIIQVSAALTVILGLTLW